MAYQIIGLVHIIGQTEQIPTKTGNLLTKRSLVLMQKRYDPNTGEEFAPNFPQLEFSGNACAQLDQFRPGDKVVVRFEVNGVTWNDKSTGEAKFMTRLRAFSVAPYVPQLATQQASQQATQQAPQQQSVQQAAPQQPTYNHQAQTDEEELPF